jgi:hypothetical protein
VVKTRTPTSPDTALFDLVHDLLKEETTAARNRRREERRPYNCVQLLAPFDGERLPMQAEFRPVRCRDLSQRGFSFYTTAPPAHPQVVIALGQVPFKFFAAAIRNVRPVERHGRTQYMVGCQFVKRLS